MLVHVRIVFALKTLSIDDQITHVAEHQPFTAQIRHQPNHLPNGTTHDAGQINIGDP